MEQARIAPRIEVVDVIRGFAIMAILLLHNIEHFDFIYRPDHLPDFVKTLDKGIFDAAHFLFSGKAYAIFALLFGFTFFLQLSKQQQLGKDFRGRFAWRMLILLLLGVVNSAFYFGDILMMYAFIAFFLLPVFKLSDRTLFIIAVVCLLQPIAVFSIAKVLLDPSIEFVKVSYFKGTKEYLADGSFFDVLWGNLTIGKKAVWLWSWEKGRFFQTYALFLLGYLAGRKQIFLSQNYKVWGKVLVWALVAAVILFFAEKTAGQCIARKAVSKPLSELIATWYNFSFMLCWVALFNLLFRKESFRKYTHFLSYIGKMALTNYMMQSVIGSFLYYGYGLGLYYYTGASYCLLIGIVFLIFQVYFCKWWLRNHSKGPLESFWHRLTWIRRS